MAHATITGQLGQDPEQRTSQDGNTTYARCSIGWSERTRDKTGQWVDGPTVWVQTTIFGRQAANIVASLHKGDRVTATGQLRAETWHGQQGENTVFTMTADTLTPNLTFATAQVTRNPKGNGNAAGGSNGAAAGTGGFGSNAAGNAGGFTGSWGAQQGGGPAGNTAGPLWGSNNEEQPPF